MAEVTTSEPEVIGKKITAKKRRCLENGKKLKALELTAMDISTKDVAIATGLSIDTVKRLKYDFRNVFKQLGNVNAFREAKADILSAAQLEALESAFSGKKLAKASFAATIDAVDKLNKMERLESNQSTSNIAVKFGELPLTIVDK